MAKLKDIKTRLQSVRSTQKITTAMMMVSSAKLQKAQKTLHNLSSYESKLSEILDLLLSKEDNFTTPFTEKRVVKRVAILAIASNTGLAGRFNHSIINELKSVVASYKSLGEENILIYPIGLKVSKAVDKMELKAEEGDFSNLITKPSYSDIKVLAEKLMEMFLQKNIDKVVLVYHHFKSKGSLIIKRDQFLPLELNISAREDDRYNNDDVVDEYIIEPDRVTILKDLLPKVLKVKLFTSFIDSSTSEHAARMIAMQIANDNADNLIDELKREYNKLRQESITNELLDIVGGSFGRS
ncbi:MAG: ATP synthase F1 subunit gamma [Bacteroidales bacterium]|nr:ATP synthase F1 subunit gamma [Bacteroidales bacterium]